MKALTLWQPWASAIALGVKTNETRSWRTEHRGLVAIHASGKGSPGQRELGRNNPVWKHLRAAGCSLMFDELPFGAVVAVATITACVRLNASEMFEEKLEERERDCGDYRPGRYAWELSDVTALKNPVRCPGARGLWTLPDDIAARVAHDAGRIELPRPPPDDLHSRIAP